jgi:ubiquinone/menaquinone biosynthesis C-methylase UbiE
MSEAEGRLKERVRAFWQAHPCGVKFADAEAGTREFFARVEEHRYGSEWHIAEAAGFAGARGLRVLEIGCGLGTDGAGFARAGAIYTGGDLTEAAVSLARRRFELEGLRGEFRVADAEALEFADESFDVVYSHGVLHHTPDIAAAVGEIHRVLRPGGRAVVMVYHRDSYNYRVNIGLLRRVGAQLLRTEAGLKLAHRLTGEPLESLREHATRIKEDSRSYLKPEEFLSRNTDGAGNPLTRVYSRAEARELFKEFAGVEVAVHYLNKRWLPVFGPMLSRGMEARLAARWGWHLWVYARKSAEKSSVEEGRESSSRSSEKESLLSA